MDKDLVLEINNLKRYIPQYYSLLDMFEGNISYYVGMSMAQELSPESFKVASTRIPAINLLRRIVKKLSKVYTDVPRRTTANPSDEEIINEYIKSLDLQNVMSNGEDMLNLQKCFAIEPYVDEGEIKLRILSPHQFCVLSDDEVNPNKVTTFVKYMGTEMIVDGINKPYNVDLYWVYTEQELIKMDSNGNVSEIIPNPYGTIPFVYVNSSSNFLMPRPDMDSYNNTVLIPKLLADLNYATQFQSHSIMYSIDAEINKASGAPDSMWNLTSRDGEGKTPQVGVLSPSVDTEKVLSLIGFTVEQWLESRGIKPGTIGGPNATASGISKIIDEADTAQVVQENRLILTHAEHELWELIGIMHNTLLYSEGFLATRGLSQDLEVSVSFPVQKPIIDPAEFRNDLEFKLKNKLTSYMRALKLANPDLTEEEINKLKEEIDAEAQPLQIMPQLDLLSPETKELDLPKNPSEDGNKGEDNGQRTE